MDQKKLPFLYGILSFFASVVLLGLCGAHIPQQDMHLRRLSANLIFFAVPIPALILRRLPNAAGFRMKDLRRNFPVLLLMIPFLFGLTICLSGLGNRIWQPAPVSLSSLYGESIPARILFCAVLPALAEEWFFRSYLLASFRTALDDLPSAFLCGVLFGWMHSGKTAMLTASAVGIVLCLFAMKTGSLLPGILFHFLNNTVGVLFPLPLLRGGIGIAAYLSGCILCGTLLILLLLIPKGSRTVCKPVSGQRNR